MTIEAITLDELKKEPAMMLEVVLEMTRGMPMHEVVSICCVTIDQAAADAGLNSEETVDLYEHICDIARSAQELFGTFPRRV